MGLSRLALNRLFALIAATAVLLSAHAIVRAADAVSIAELMAAKKKGEWPAYAQSGASMKIEGRYSTFSTSLLRFLKCDDLNFVWYAEDEPFPINPSTSHSRNLEVLGHFEMRGGKPAFVVRRLRPLPSDEDALRDRRESLADAAPEQWYALGDWAASRGAFYADQPLIQQSHELYVEGLKREQKLLPEDALDRRLALAKKYTRYGVPDEERLQFIEESLALRWLSLKGGHPTAADLDELCNRIDQNLQGCKAPLTVEDDGLRKRAARDLIGVYRTASAAERLRINRALWIDVRTAYWNAWASEHNRDSMQLADRIDREIPELHGQAESLRSGVLDQRLKDVIRLSRDDLLDLAEQFQRRGQPERAREAKRAWVKAKEERLAKTGNPSDLMQAAHEYRALLEDNESAARLLIEASKIAPESKDIAEQLAGLHYKRVNGKWLTAAEVAALPPDPLQKAAEAGRFTGMTREQILKAVGSPPDSRTRVISAGKLSEVWIYDQNSKSRLAIHFVGSADGHDVTAVRVVQ